MVEARRMTVTGRVMSSEYMHWAKTQSQARFGLAGSGLMHYPMADFPAKLEDIDLNGPSGYGYQPLQRAIATYTGAPEECVVAATGASMANYLAMAVTVEPGDEVVIEHPAYELLVNAAENLGAKVKRFSRSIEDGWRINLRSIERAVSRLTRLIVMTNLHNPTSAFTDQSTMRALGEIARNVGAHVLVGEVYLHALFEQAPRSAFHLGPEFITTDSLTKVYGLSGLRCGWALATPDLARKMWRLNDLFGVIPAHPAERLSCVAFENLDRIAARSREILDMNRRSVNRMLKARKDVVVAQQDFGTVIFPRLESRPVEALCKLLRTKYETSVVPGSFFDMPQHFRIGLGNDPKITADGLERICEALDELEG
jgi:aspartate/methionine/tyrosine aminotransferase